MNATINGKKSLEQHLEQFQRKSRSLADDISAEFEYRLEDDLGYSQTGWALLGAVAGATHGYLTQGLAGAAVGTVAGVALGLLFGTMGGIVAEEITPSRAHLGAYPIHALEGLARGVVQLPAYAATKMYSLVQRKERELH